MPGTLGHLTSRFFDVAFSKRLDPGERATVEAWLAPRLAEIFFDQPAADQRHGYEAGLTVLEAGAHPDAVVAAVMHDTGKRRAGLGVVGRVAASLLIKTGMVMSHRVRRYRDHGTIAAQELASAGAPRLAIDFARHHHGTRPSSIPLETWEILVQADQPNPTRRSRWGISSSAK